MRSVPENRSLPSREAPGGAALPDRQERIRRWLPLLAALVLLPFANGVDSVPLAAWLAPVFLLRFTRGRRPLAGFVLTAAIQMLALAVQFRGMVPFPPVVYAIVMGTYALAFALPYLADRLLARRVAAFARTLVFPAAWVGVEFVVGLGPFGSWFSAAYSQYGSLPVLQILSVTGLGGVTFLIGWFAAAGNVLWEEFPVRKRVPVPARLCAGAIAAACLLGGARLALFPPSGPAVRVASLSGAGTPLHPDPRVVGRFFGHRPLTPEEIATIRKSAAAIDDDLLARSEREARAGARIVFWGEANAPVMKDDEDALVRRGSALARQYGIYLGMTLASWHLESTPPLENKIVMIAPDGKPAWEFFKAHPVPGGESMISIRRDGRLRSLDTPYGRLSSVICFDADFPRLLAQAGRLGADILLDPSNDWRAIDPWHTRMASFRAIEQGFQMVRHTSQGLSAAFDFQGRLLASMDHYAASDRTLVVQMPTRGRRTLYSIFGDGFGWGCLAGLLALAVTSGRRARLPAV